MSQFEYLPLILCAASCSWVTKISKSLFTPETVSPFTPKTCVVLSCRLTGTACYIAEDRGPFTSHSKFALVMIIYAKQIVAKCSNGLRNLIGFKIQAKDNWLDSVISSSPFVVACLCLQENYFFTLEMSNFFFKLSSFKTTESWEEI